MIAGASQSPICLIDLSLGVEPSLILFFSSRFVKIVNEEVELVLEGIMYGDHLFLGGFLNYVVLCYNLACVLRRKSLTNKRLLIFYSYSI